MEVKELFSGFGKCVWKDGRVAVPLMIGQKQ